MQRKCSRLIDIKKNMAVQYNNRLRGRTVMFLPASCPHSVVVTMGNCRHKFKVLDVPLGWGQRSQMTSALG